ncbi:hypothetical protein [Roseomonas sp. HF4]|uniref:hypothetical protein n=1 Tax=Roseomonas sp. HF4 TaxID=2562313 RepID=UPI0010BFDF44|nr:hypothetical protein [Roseomonas sp. HF4]
MGAQPETNDAVLDLAFGAAGPAGALLRAEACMIGRRNGPADVPGAVRRALAAAGGSAELTRPMARAALAIGEAVERHGAAFPPGAEPAYHDRHHQAEAVLAMGWLAGAARRIGLLDTAGTDLAVAAMAAHDLLHDGKVHAERGVLERRSADAAAGMAAAAGVDAGAIAALRRIVLATTWPWEEAEAPDLLCRLAREADLFGSALPVLGPRLSRMLAAEIARAGQPAPDDVATHAARVALLGILPPPTAPARALGLDAARDAQLAAYARAADSLAISPPTPEAGAAALDAMAPADAEALLARQERAP